MATTPVIAWVRDPKDNQLAHGSYSLSTPTLGTRTGTLSTTGPSLRVEGVTCGEVVTLTLTITGQPAPLTVYRRVPPSYAASPWRRPWLPAAPPVPFDLGVQVGYFDPQEVGKDMATGSAGGAASVAGAGSNVVVKDELGVWSLTKAQADAAHAAGAKLLWYGTPAPTAAEGVAYLDVVNGTVSTANKPSPPPPANNNLTVAYSGSAWDKTPVQVATARAAGGAITWNGTTVLPEASDGLGEGDTVNGTFTQPSPTMPLAKIAIPTWVVPAKVDGDAGADFIRLNKYTGLNFIVDGVTYTSAAMSGASQDVSTGGKTSIPVSVVPANPANFGILDSTSAWGLTFNTTDTWITIPVGAAPVGNDGVGTGTDTITLTKVDGVIWTVNGDDHPSSGFAGATKVVDYAGGVSTTVTAKPEPGYAISTSSTTSWPLSFTNSMTSVVTSANFSNYSHGTNFNDPATWDSNAYAGGTAFTAQPAKYCTINNGAMQVKAGGSYFAVKTGLTAAPNNLIVEFNCKLSNGDVYLCPPQDSNGTAQGVRIAGGFYFGAGKRQSYTYSAGTYASGASKVITPTDRLKVVINKAAATTTGYVNDVQQFVVANTTMPPAWSGGWLYFECTSGPVEIADIVVSTS